jgi:hypothetical protein
MRCLSPGNWLSEDGTIAAIHMCAGSRDSQWELYLTAFAKRNEVANQGDVRRVPSDPDTVEFLCCDHWCSAFTFGELARDIAKLADWRHNLVRNIAEVGKRQDQDLRLGFGPPDPRLGWYPYEEGRKARQPMLRRVT